MQVDKNSKEWEIYVAFKKRQEQDDESLGISNDFEKRLARDLADAPKRHTMPPAMFSMAAIAKANKGKVTTEAEKQYAKVVLASHKKQKSSDFMGEFMAALNAMLGDVVDIDCDDDHNLSLKNAFVVDNDNKNIIQYLNQYFNHGYKSTPKGFWIFGPVGTGKTLIAKALEIALKAIEHPLAFTTVSAEQIEQERKNGVNVVDKYGQGYWLFDDLGVDQSFKDFGNEVDPMVSILFKIYEKRKFKRTFVTSNLSPVLSHKFNIQSRYGERIADRCNEMFEFKILGGESRRK